MWSIAKQKKVISSIILCLRNSSRKTKPYQQSHIFILLMICLQASEDILLQLSASESLHHSFYHIPPTFATLQCYYSIQSFDSLVMFALSTMLMWRCLNSMQIFEYYQKLLIINLNIVSKLVEYSTRSNGVFSITLSFNFINY